MAELHLLCDLEGAELNLGVTCDSVEATAYVWAPGPLDLPAVTAKQENSAKFSAGELLLALPAITVWNGANAGYVAVAGPLELPAIYGTVITSTPYPYVEFLYSGGAGNIDPLLSLGGGVSSAVGKYVEGQTFSGTSIPGISIVRAGRNPEGDGTLTYNPMTRTLYWQPYNSNFLYETSITIDKLYAVGAASIGYLVVSVTNASLPVDTTQTTIAIQAQKETLFDSLKCTGVTSVDYRCLYIRNASVEDFALVQISVTAFSQPSSLWLASERGGYYETNAEGLYTLTPVYQTGLILSDGLSEKYLGGLQSIAQNGMPIAILPYNVDAQESDGVSYNVPPVLADRQDSTGVLEDFLWVDKLVFSHVAPDTLIPIWVRRDVPEGVVSPAQETARLNLKLTTY